MKLLRATEVIERTGVSRRTIDRLEHAGRFPRRRALTGGTVGWVEAEVDRWIRTRPVASPVESTVPRKRGR